MLCSILDLPLDIIRMTALDHLSAVDIMTLVICCIPFYQGIIHNEPFWRKLYERDLSKHPHNWNNYAAIKEFYSRIKNDRLVFAASAGYEVYLTRTLSRNFHKKVPHDIVSKMFHKCSEAGRLDIYSYLVNLTEYGSLTHINPAVTSGNLDLVKFIVQRIRSHFGLDRYTEEEITLVDDSAIIEYRNYLQAGMVQAFRQSGKLHIVEYLLTQGASFDTPYQDEVVNPNNPDELITVETTLMDTALSSCLDNVRYLRDKGINLPEKALYIALRESRDVPDLIEYLLGHYNRNLTQFPDILESVAIENAGWLPTLTELVNR